MYYILPQHGYNTDAERIRCNRLPNLMIFEFLTILFLAYAVIC